MTDLFSMLHADSKSVGETNDCAVKAVALATGRPYREVLRKMRAYGRRPRRGTPMRITKRVLEDYGYTMVLQTERFPQARTPITVARTMPKRGVYLVRTSRHIFCYRAGKVHDWTEGRRHRVTQIWKIVRA